MPAVETPRGARLPALMVVPGSQGGFSPVGQGFALPWVLPHVPTGVLAIGMGGATVRIVLPGGRGSSKSSVAAGWGVPAGPPLPG